MEISKKEENTALKERANETYKKKKIMKKALISKKLRIPLIALVIVFHFVSCICIGLVISLYSFPINKYTEGEIEKYNNIANTIMHSGINKLNYYSIDIHADADSVNIGKIYTSGINDMEYSKFSLSIRMNNLEIETDNNIIYFIPNDERKNFDYIAIYHISTNTMDFTNSYEDIRFNYILKWNTILSILCLILIIIIYFSLGVFKRR